MLAPILVFTSDEIWENLPADSKRPAFVHLALLPVASGDPDDGLLSDWQDLFEIREEVLHSLEEARIAKQIGSSLEAQVEISASGESYDLLTRYQEELRFLFIVSAVNVVNADEGVAGVRVKVLRAAGKKCERCWNYSARVGESSRYPDVCERCVAALEEIEEDSAN
jgi:isoleucyl-tRNA synthetase